MPYCERFKEHSLISLLRAQRVMSLVCEYLLGEQKHDYRGFFNLADKVIADPMAGS